MADFVEKIDSMTPRIVSVYRVLRTSPMDELGSGHMLIFPLFRCSSADNFKITRSEILVFRKSMVFLI